MFTSFDMCISRYVQCYYPVDTTLLNDWNLQDWKMTDWKMSDCTNTVSLYALPGIYSANSLVLL